MGYRVQSEIDEALALEIVQAEMFEGMILNIGIPSMSGMDVLRQIRRSAQQVPIVLVAASGVVVLYTGPFGQIGHS